ncbi:hypothetical protein [Pedobacter insulae]|uniref:DUF4369 domain-containing protein n=1 Tax=Pedobacter insulae TaxID=414048 RepID=A0A1I2SQJ3_9SPHI|nr:hypothetical protein [Pedobacter insulae]SFG54988.1 hypothetical protein SAMN04489864_1014 [Pedobacter insulae]
MKRLLLFIFLSLLFFGSYAQDAVLISEGNFVRGIIKGTNYSSVALQQDDQTIVQYQAKDIQSFVWNGETYVSKPILVKKKAENRFFKLIEAGTVNLYSLGDKKANEQPQPARVKVRPTFGVGMGSGGFGGGLGGGISIGGGGGRSNNDPIVSPTNGKVFYFIEKPGSGPMQEVLLGNTAAVKNILLQKLTNDEDLAERIKASEEFTDLNLIAFIKSYNASKP